MPVYTFSAPEKRPQDIDAVRRVKQYCEQHKLNFSAVVVELLKRYEEEVINAK